MFWLLLRQVREAPMLVYKVIGLIQGSGSGKTMAYLAPIISMLMGKAKKLAKPKPIAGLYDPKVDAIRAEPLVLILCPTRELALQIFNEARKMCYRSFLRPCVLHGGGRLYDQQIADLQRGCDILIGTTGRVRDMMLNRSQWLSMCRVKYATPSSGERYPRNNN